MTRPLEPNLTDQGRPTGLEPFLEHRTRSAYWVTKPRKSGSGPLKESLGADLGPS